MLRFFLTETLKWIFWMVVVIHKNIQEILSILSLGPVKESKFILADIQDVLYKCYSKSGTFSAESLLGFS